MRGRPALARSLRPGQPARSERTVHEAPASLLHLEWMGRKLNLLNAQDNVTAGIILLRSLTRSAHTQDQAIAGYYQGLYSVQNVGMYADTKRYVASVVLLKRQMQV